MDSVFINGLKPMNCIGIDICKASFDVAVLQANGKHRTRSKIANATSGFKELVAWRALHAPGAPIVMEATSVYHEALADWLFEQGIDVYVVNPARVAGFAKSMLSRTKTDRTDAKLIADFGTAMLSSTKPCRRWRPLAPSARTLRALAKRLDDLKEMRQMELNRLDVADPSVIPSIQAVITQLGQAIIETEQTIRDHIDDDPDLRRRRDLLESIPGIGETTSAWLLDLLGEHNEFECARQLEAYVGLNPKVRQSGAYAGQARISKMGDPRLRSKLYMPAVVAMSHNPALRALRDRLRARGKPGLVVVVAAMRKLLNLAYGVLRSGERFDLAKSVAA